MFFFCFFFCLQHSSNGYSQFQASFATCNKAFCPGATTEAMRGSVLCPGCQQPQRAAEPGLPHTLPREAAPPAFWGAWEAVPASHVHFALFHSHNGAPVFACTYPQKHWPVALGPVMALLGDGAQVHIKPTCTSGQHQGEEREAQSVLAGRAATPLCTV